MVALSPNLLAHLDSLKATDLEQAALAVFFANCQGIKSDPLPMLRKILALGEGDRYRKALEDIRAHMEIVSPTGCQLSTVYRIAIAALRGEGV